MKNGRGITLMEAIDSVGLSDIENRDNLERVLPPAAFYGEAKYEIVISAITAFRTFDHNRSLLCRAIDDGKKVFILIVHPKSAVYLTILLRICDSNGMKAPKMPNYLVSLCVTEMRGKRKMTRVGLEPTTRRLIDG